MQSTVAAKIATVFLVIVVGWVARRRGYLAGAHAAALSRFGADVALPALAFVQMLRTADAASLREGWYCPVLCAAVLGLGAVVALVFAPLCSPGRRRRTFSLLAALSNYVFLPLPIAQALYGEAGVRTILLCNIGGTAAVWVLGPWLLQGRAPLRQTARQVLGNPGLIATVAGIACGLAFPGLRALANGQAGGSLVARLVAAPALQAAAIVGDLTVPLALLVIGAQLGALQGRFHRPSRAVAGILVARLVVAPAVVLGLILLGQQAGVRLPLVPRVATLLIAGMPVAFASALLAERYDGDVDMTVQSIFLSTLVSLATVPALLNVARWLGA